MEDRQREVAAFVAEHDLETPPAYRLLDLVSEVGELAKDVNESTEYGDDPAELDISADELGDVLFATLAVADAVGIDADEALDEALAKYERRLEDGETPGSGSESDRGE